MHKINVTIEYKKFLSDRPFTYLLHYIRIFSFSIYNASNLNSFNFVCQENKTAQLLDTINNHHSGDLQDLSFSNGHEDFSDRGHGTANYGQSVMTTGTDMTSGIRSLKPVFMRTMWHEVALMNTALTSVLKKKLPYSGILGD